MLINLSLCRVSWNKNPQTYCYDYLDILEERDNVIVDIDKSDILSVSIVAPDNSACKRSICAVNLKEEKAKSIINSTDGVYPTSMITKGIGDWMIVAPEASVAKLEELLDAKDNELSTTLLKNELEEKI